MFTKLVPYERYHEGEAWGNLVDWLEYDMARSRGGGGVRGWGGVRIDAPHVRRNCKK